MKFISTAFVDGKTVMINLLQNKQYTISQTKQYHRNEYLLIQFQGHGFIKTILKRWIQLRFFFFYI